MFLASDKRKLRFYLVTGDKICQLLVLLPPGYVIMVYTSSVQWYGFPRKPPPPTYGEMAHS